MPYTDHKCMNDTCNVESLRTTQTSEVGLSNIIKGRIYFQA